MQINETLNTIDKILQAKNYLVAMTVYHIVAIFLFVKGIEGFKLQAMVGIDQSLVDRSASIFDILSTGKGLIATLIIITIILGIDIVFLIILSHDFRGLNLTWNKMYIIEGILFILTLCIPVLRALLLFFSLNTIQIFIFYHLATMLEKWNFVLLRYIIVLGGYILVLKIAYFTITHL